MTSARPAAAPAARVSPRTACAPRFWTLPGRVCCKIAGVDDEWQYGRAAEHDRILGQTTSLLAQRGDERAVALLVDVRSMGRFSTGEVLRAERTFDPWMPTGDDSSAIMTVYRRAAVLDVDD